MNRTHPTVLAALAAALAASLSAQQFDKPFRIESEGKPIDVEIGHAAPYVVDFDGDGVRDLLVGQFGKGRCRIYKNVGTDAAPKFAGFVFFEAGGKVAEVAAS